MVTGEAGPYPVASASQQAGRIDQGHQREAEEVARPDEPADLVGVDGTAEVAGEKADRRSAPALMPCSSVSTGRSITPVKLAWPAKTTHLVGNIEGLSAPESGGKRAAP